jgi:TatD DNase family protein
MKLFDTHAHLEMSEFDADRGEVLARARAAGVELILNAGSDPKGNRDAQALALAEPDVYAAAGLHPHEVPRLTPGAWAELPDRLAADKVVAVGECGLDYHVFPEFPVPDRAAQREAFARQLRLARVFELPLIVHVREAEDDAFALLRAEGPFPAGGVFHCYGGGPAHLDAVLELGFHVGFGGTLTYPKADGVRAALKTVPAERLLLETDAPYLPPQPRRGKRNEPAYLVEIADVAAAVRGMRAEELAVLANANARRLFRLQAGDPGALVYPVGPNLYVNLTNRCTADCLFCPRRTDRRLHGTDLTLQREPLPAEVLAAIGDPARYGEIVFCGFGEPVLRLGALLAVARGVKARGGRVRVNTNGQADLIFGRDILPECAGAVDEWSVSLNTADPAQYDALVRPAFGPGLAWPAVTEFIARAARTGFAVTVTEVDLPEVDDRAVAVLAARLGARFRGRPHARLSD